MVGVPRNAPVLTKICILTTTLGNVTGGSQCLPCTVGRGRARGGERDYYCGGGVCSEEGYGSSPDPANRFPACFLQCPAPFPAPILGVRRIYALAPQFSTRRRAVRPFFQVYVGRSATLAERHPVALPPCSPPRRRAAWIGAVSMLRTHRDLSETSARGEVAGATGDPASTPGVDSVALLTPAAPPPPSLAQALGCY